MKSITSSRAELGIYSVTLSAGIAQSTSDEDSRSLMGNGETVRMAVQYMSRGRQMTGVTEILKMRAGSTGKTESEVGVSCVSCCHIKSSKETRWDVS